MIDQNKKAFKAHYHIKQNTNNMFIWTFICLNQRIHKINKIIPMLLFKLAGKKLKIRYKITMICTIYECLMSNAPKIDFSFKVLLKVHYIYMPHLS